jgi:signal transduction histidine kinase
MDSWLEHFATAMFRRSIDTAHDLKTPLNVAVLNLELLRMRVRKIADDDAKIAEYAASIETELRRMAAIFDAFFIFCTPPNTDAEPHRIDVAPLLAAAASNAGFTVQVDPFFIMAHQSRIQQAFKLFFDGASRVFPPEGAMATVVGTDTQLDIQISGSPIVEYDPLKVFKFYYTDPSGNPDLSLAAARLIIETYGGELNVDESDTLRLSLRGSQK